MTRTPHRLFVENAIVAGTEIPAAREQANYLLNVLRLKDKNQMTIFNGRDGEWRAEVKSTGRKSCTILPVKMLQSQPAAPELEYLFAPLKQARLDYMVQKAVEMGVGSLRPVITEYTQVRSLNLKRMHANAVEAAEQCEILNIPEIHEPEKLDNVLEGWDSDWQLIFCDESLEISNPIKTLGDLKPEKLALLIGPEGGFSCGERERLHKLPFVVAIGLGPRVLRADTAAIAALGVIQAILGDW